MQNQPKLWRSWSISPLLSQRGRESPRAVLLCKLQGSGLMPSWALDPSASQRPPPFFHQQCQEWSISRTYPLMATLVLQVGGKELRRNGALHHKRQLRANSNPVAAFTQHSTPQALFLSHYEMPKGLGSYNLQKIKPGLMLAKLANLFRECFCWILNPPGYIVM